MPLWTGRVRCVLRMLAATLAVGLAQAVGAQARPPQIGERVRLTLLPDSGGHVAQVVGTVGALGGDTLLLLLAPEQSIPIPVALISRIDGSVFHRSLESLQRHNVRIGAVAGTIPGVAIGASVFLSQMARTMNPLSIVGSSVGATLGCALAASVGAVLGLVIADHQETDRWAPLAVPALSPAQ